MSKAPTSILVHRNISRAFGDGLLDPYFQRQPDRKPALPLVRITYALPEGQLEVINLEVADARNLRTGTRSVLHDVFESADDRIITGYTGIVIFYGGRREGISSTESLDKWEYYDLLEIRRGRLRSERHYDHAQLELFKKDQFDYFCLTDEYEVLRATAQIEFEKGEQEARRKDPNRGYRSFDEKAFNERMAKGILEYSKEFLAD